MAYYDQCFYCNAGDQSTTGYYAVAKWAATTAVVAGALRRQLTAPAVNSERVFVCIVAGTTGSTEPTWVLTRGAKTTDGTVTWMECTGIAAVNGDLTNTINWTAAKAIGVPTLGTIIKRNNGASYQICTTAGTLGAAEPAFSDTAGVTTTETSATTVWTSLGVVGNFTGGQAPHARLAAACATNWFAAGNTVYVGDNHAETQASTINLSPAVSSNISMSSILCHNHSGSYPPTSANLTTGAVVSTTTAGNINWTVSGLFYVYGISFRAGVGSSGANFIFINPNPTAWQYFDNCSFWLSGTQASGTYIALGSVGTNNSNVVVWNNCTVKFAVVQNRVTTGSGVFTWQNTGPVLAAGSVVPSSFIGFADQAAAFTVALTLEALDLSQINTALFFNSSNCTGYVLVKDCKLNATATVLTPVVAGLIFQFVRCDSGTAAYKSVRYQYEGTETTETSITRVGGASDPTGQQQSRKIITTANSQWLHPFKAEPYAIWNPRTAANVTVTVCGTVNVGALPNNDDIWMDVEYLGSSATPLGTIVNTTKANLLAANAAVASDSSSWNNMPSYASFDDVISGTGTLSNGNLTFTWATLTSGVGSLSGFSTGKYYCEFKVTETSGAVGDCVGFKLLATPISNFGPATTGLVVSTNVGGTATVNIDGVLQSGAALGTFVSNDVICGAIDLANHLVWFRRNGGNWNNSGTANPATSVGGISYTAGVYCPTVVFTNGGSAKSVTADFGAASYAFTPPSGFSNWPISWSPFKLTTTLSSPQPGLPGYIHVRPKVAKPSSTFYLDPQVTLS